MTRKLTAGAIAAMGLAAAGCQTTGTGGAGVPISDILVGIGAVTGATGQVNSADADAALRQALEIGATRAVSQLSATDGFWGDPQVRIPLPDALADTQATLARVGLSGPIDDLELKMNRAAEAATPAAKKLFVDAITSMTVEDALGIVSGGETAATDFLRTRTEANLRTQFTPIVNTAMAEVGALQALDQVTASVPMAAALGGDVKGQLTTRVVDAALDGVFLYVAREEAAIRSDPVRRTTDLLRRVFG